MPFFRKKPVVIEARRVPVWREPSGDGTPVDHYVDECIALAEWCGGKSFMMGEDDNHILIHTLEGDHKALPGDWIIKGVKGEFYPCKPDIFEDTYEAAESPRLAARTPEDRHQGLSDPLG